MVALAHTETTRSIPLTELTIDERLQKRPEGLNEEHIKDLQRAIQVGAPIDPIDVFQLPDDQLLLADGFHRYEAAHLEGWLAIECRMFAGTFEDAEWHACSVNQHRNSALKRSSETLTAQIRSALLNPRSHGLSNRQIAAHVGTHDKKIADVRRQLENEGLLQTQDTRTVTRNGQSYEMNVKPIAARKATIEEAQALWAQVGTIKPARKGSSFVVENDRMGTPFPIVVKKAADGIAAWNDRGAKLLDYALRNDIAPIRTGDRVEIAAHADDDLIGKAGTIAGIFASVELAFQFKVELDDNQGLYIPCRPIELKKLPSAPIESTPEITTGDRVLTPDGYGTAAKVGENLITVEVEGKNRRFPIESVDLACKVEPEPITPSRPQVRVSFALNGETQIGKIVNTVTIETSNGDRVQIPIDQIQFL